MKPFFTILLLIPAVASGQTAHAPVVDQQLAAVANLPVHKLAANDLIALSVYDSPELTRTVRVGPEGLIDLPLLREPIKAAGLLPTELEGAIANSLKSQDILVRPLVTVTVIAYNNRNVSVLGAVHRPLSFEVIGATRLMDALSRAEGTTSDAGPEILLSRAGQPGVTHIDLLQLMSGSDPALNAPLEGGEEIRIPEARKVYVVGNVKKPGAIPIRDNSEATVLKLLAVVEGVTPYYQPTAWIYRVDPATKTRTEIRVELKKILARKSPDVTLGADDILYIPDSVNKRAAVETGKILLTTGTGVLSALLYSGKL